jgi:hypothetical protein
VSSGLIRSSTNRYKPRRPGPATLEHHVKEISQSRARFGYLRFHVRAVSCAPLFSLSGAATLNTVGDESFGRRNIEAAIKSNRFQLVACEPRRASAV